MNIKDFLQKVSNQIKYKPAKLEIEKELETHIQEAKEEYIKNGMQEKKAEEKAIQQMGKPEVIGKSLNKIHRPKLDWKLLLLVIVLIGFGLFITNVKSVTDSNYMERSTVYILIGIILSIPIYFCNYRKMQKYSGAIYIVATVLIISPKIIGSSTINGVYCLDVFNTIISTATIALPLYVISFAGYIAKYNIQNIFKIKIFQKEIFIQKDFFKILILSMISFVLILRVPSISNAVVLLIAYLTIAGIKIMQNNTKKLPILIGMISVFLAMVMLALVINPNNYMETSIAKIVSSFYPELDPQNNGYVGMLQKRILENAKIIGEAQIEVINSNNYQYEALNKSNYAFIYLVGKVGWLISGMLVITIILTSIRLILNAKNIKEVYGKWIVIGLSILYIVQSATNVLMNINMSIQTDINLPFVSGGNEYLIINMVSIALILAIYRRKDIESYETKKNSVRTKLSV